MMATWDSQTSSCRLSTTSIRERFATLLRLSRHNAQSNGSNQKHFLHSCVCEEWNAFHRAATPRLFTAINWFCELKMTILRLSITGIQESCRSLTIILPNVHSQ